MDAIKFVEDQMSDKKTLIDFKAGDTITVHYKIKEGDKERIQQFTGVVIQVKNNPGTRSFTVRKISNGIGVERIFPLNSPFIEKIEMKKKGVVRRAKLYYLRTLTGKSARIREKIEQEGTETAATVEPVTA